MNAVVFHGPNRGLKTEDVPVPKVGPNQMLVKVGACGECPTDLRYIEHGVPIFKKPPIVLGHEASGTVVELGGAAAKDPKRKVAWCSSVGPCEIARSNPRWRGPAATVTRSNSACRPATAAKSTS